jgi:hypothetical protein
MFAAHRTPRRTRPGVHELSARTVPAVVLTKLDLDGDGAADDVRIVGDAGNNAVTLTDNGSTSVTIKIDANGDGVITDKGGDLEDVFAFTSDSWVLDVRLGGGNDRLNYDVAGVMGASARTILADLGSGADHFGFLTQAAVTGSSRLAFDVTAGSGADSGEIGFLDTIVGSSVSVRTDWGTGGDQVFMVFGGAIDAGAAVDVHTDLGGGANSLGVGFDRVGGTDAATADLVVLGGAKSDDVRVSFEDDVGNGVKASRLNVVADLGAGSDDFEAAFRANAFWVDNNSQVSVAARGGAGTDTLRAHTMGDGFCRIDAGGLLAVHLDGGVGVDDVAVDFSVPDSWYLELGATMQLRLVGGLGADTLAVNLSNTAGTDGAYDVAVRGGAGDDTATFTFLNPGSPTFGPANGVVLDGGTGIDVAEDGNPFVTLRTGFETVI